MQARRQSGMELWSYGGVLQAQRRGDMEVWRIELWRHTVSVATGSYSGLELWSSGARAAGVATWRRRGMDRWSRAASVATWR